MEVRDSVRSPPLQGNVPPNTYKPAESDHFSQLVFASCIRCPTHTSTDFKTQFLLFVRLEKRVREMMMMMMMMMGRERRKKNPRQSRACSPRTQNVLSAYLLFFFDYFLLSAGAQKRKMNQRLQKIITKRERERAGVRLD